MHPCRIFHKTFMLLGSRVWCGGPGVGAGLVWPPSPLGWQFCPALLRIHALMLFNKQPRRSDVHIFKAQRSVVEGSKPWVSSEDKKAHAVNPLASRSVEGPGRFCPPLVPAHGPWQASGLRPGHHDRRHVAAPGVCAAVCGRPRRGYPTVRFHTPNASRNKR